MLIEKDELQQEQEGVLVIVTAMTIIFTVTKIITNWSSSPSSSS